MVLTNLYSLYSCISHCLLLTPLKHKSGTSCAHKWNNMFVQWETCVGQALLLVNYFNLMHRAPDSFGRLVTWSRDGQVYFSLEAFNIFVFCFDNLIVMCPCEFLFVLNLWFIPWLSVPKGCHIFPCMKNLKPYLFKYAFCIFLFFFFIKFCQL